jgi:hypothetical protein
MQEENITQEQPIEDLEMEYLQATSELTPWMIHLRLNGDGRYIYRMSGFSLDEDPMVYFDIDTFLLPIEESKSILLTEDSVPVQDISIWNYVSNQNNISFYFWEKIAYSIHFPLKWAIQEYHNNRHRPSAFGPKVCEICEKYGFQDGIFMGYCVDCAEKCLNSDKENSASLDVSL